MGLWRKIAIVLLIVHYVNSQGGQPCFTNTGASGVCTSVSACPTSFQLNINPFSFFGGAQQGCQNFLGIGSVCCANAASYAVPPNNPTQPPVFTTTTSAGIITPPTAARSPASTARPQVGLECVRADGSVGPCMKAAPVTTATARSSTIRTTTPIVLQTRLDSEPTFDKPVSLPTPHTGCGDSDVEHNRVVGGVPAALHGWPWMALVGYANEFGDIDFLCGGSLITDRHVLSAAHCIQSSLSTVRLGEHDLDNQTESAHVDVPVYKYVSHPSYDTFDGHSDLAILFLSRTVEFNDAIKPICLPTFEPIRGEKFIGFNPFIAGWGRTAENGFEAKVLQELQIPILENDECVQLFKKIRKLFTRKQFNDAVICAGFVEGGKDSCQGDSGGPLMLPYLVNKKYYYFQVGVVSYGIGCARAELPGVYTRVASFIDWIKLQIEAN
uniref:Peptidase S1 domain-containing protein n=1 Tax=Anopheles atroparvus TaxID=41427 RepID=A0AAG5CUG3_ANOAO